MRGKSEPLALDTTIRWSLTIFAQSAASLACRLQHNRMHAVDCSSSHLLDIALEFTPENGMDAGKLALAVYNITSTGLMQVSQL